MFVTKVTKVLVGLILISSISVFGQDVTPDAPPSLKAQYEQMLESSETFKQYKVIDISKLKTFWSTVADSINQKEISINEAKGTINSQREKISELEDQIKAQQEEVDEAKYGQEHLVVLGLDFQKDVFVIIAFSVIGILIAFIVLGYSTYKKSQKVAASKTREYNKLEEEYKHYQDKAREKQMKVKRELQTYVNKVEEMKHKNISFK